MGLLNPVNALLAPFLFLVTVPLAIFAGITTTLAFSVLLLRVAFVYLDIALSLLPASLTSIDHRAHVHVAEKRVARQASPLRSGPPYHHRRRRSSVSVASAGSAPPAPEHGIGLIPSVGAERDFEGVGGWRVGDDNVWTTVNAKLELPDRPYGRHHQRSPSGGFGGPTTPGDGGYLMMRSRTRSPGRRRAAASVSPNSSRARTPTGPKIALTGMAGSDGYFPLAPSPKSSKRSGGASVD